ncbi:amidase [Amycolatopsis antarctica]|uniref:Amidase n=1 Tax=Amycolatopsis antarctica TaxID=1854586 RepID=A0A263CW52_9PSEU|nr:amidase [Amycolatopsis antarctica]OZM70321.1 amidase [Amycolatopsis antarctica]
MTPTLANAGLATLAQRLARREVTSADLVADTLRRIDEAQPTLNAFRHVRTEAAIREAAAADRGLDAGERAPLLGVPVAIKDDTDLAGYPTAFGCPGEFPVSETDAELVTRLKAAGAVIVGKTNTPEIGQWPFTEGSAFGATRNPWNSDFSAGGSSGGSAAAVAAGLVPAAIGSDGAGSVRIPAAWNNLVGIKTQRGLVSTAPEAELFHGLTVHGPLARTVGDAALLLDVMADAGTRYRTAARREPGRLRVGLSARIPFTGTDTSLHPEVRAAVARLAGSLRALGHELVPVRPRYRLAGLHFLPRSLAGVHAWAGRTPDAALLDPRTRANARTGRLLGGRALRLARAAEPLLHKRIGAVFQDVDVLLVPTTATPPFRVGTFDSLTGWQTDQAMIAACPYAWPWNLLGWPGVNVPAGPDGDGLPLGAQLLGPESSEELLISLAAQLESVERWQDRRPAG